MTFGKHALTLDNTDQILVKGVQLDRFILKTSNDQISQGVIEYVNSVKIEKVISKKKLSDLSNSRIALQGLTGVNENRRLKSTIIKENIFLANSCNYLLSSNLYNLEILTGLLNSRLLNYIFKARSTSSNVNGYEVDSLPIPKYIDEKSKALISKIVSEILQLKNHSISNTTIDLEVQIDQLVYELYGLTEDEIAIMEGK